MRINLVEARFKSRQKALEPLAPPKSEPVQVTQHRSFDKLSLKSKMRHLNLGKLAACLAILYFGFTSLSQAQPTHKMICDSHQWFQGFDVETTDIDYTVFDMSKEEDYVALGGYKSNDNKAIVTVYKFKDRIELRRSLLISASDVGLAKEFEGVSDLRFGKGDSLFAAFISANSKVVVLHYDFGKDDHQIFKLSHANVDNSYSRSIKLGVANSDKTMNLFYRRSTYTACPQTYRWFHLDMDMIENSQKNTISLCSLTNSKFMAEMAQQWGSPQQSEHFIFFLAVDTLAIVLHAVDMDTSNHFERYFHFTNWDAFNTDEFNATPAGRPVYYSDYHIVALKSGNSVVAIVLDTSFYTIYVPYNKDTDEFDADVKNKFEISTGATRWYVMAMLSEENDSKVDILVEFVNSNGTTQLYLITGFDTSLTDHSVTVYKIYHVVFPMANGLPSWYTSQDWHVIWKFNKNQEFMKAGNTALILPVKDSVATNLCLTQTLTELAVTQYPLTVTDGEGGSNLVTYLDSTWFEFTYVDAYAWGLIQIFPGPLTENFYDSESVFSGFNLHDEPGYMINPCEVKVRQFADIEFTELTPTNTVMGTYLPIDPADTAVYTCPDATYPLTSEFPIVLSVDKIHDTSTQCTTWIETPSVVSDYAVVTAGSQESITFLAADPASSQWYGSNDSMCEIEYSIGYQAAANLFTGDIMTTYRTEFAVQCEQVSLPDDWDSDIFYVYSNPTVKQVYTFEGASQSPGCGIIRLVERESYPNSGIYVEVSGDIYDPVTDTLTLEFEEVLFSQTLRFKYSIMTEDLPETSRQEKVFEIRGVYCPMLMPELQAEYFYDLASEDSLLIEPIGADNDYCEFTCSYSQLPGEPFSLHSGRSRPGQGSTCDGILVSPSTDISLIDTVHTFEFTLSSQLFPRLIAPKSTSFQVTLTSTAQFCDSNLVLQKIDNIVLFDGESETLELTQSGNGNCMYRLELEDAVTRQAVDSSLFQVEQASFTQWYPQNQLMVRVESYASLTIAPSKQEHIGMHSLILTMLDDFHLTSKQFRFKVTVLKFEPAIDCHFEYVTLHDSLKLNLKYPVGAETATNLIACSKSKMTINVVSQPSGLLQMPSFIEFVDSVEHEASIRVYTNSTADVGSYVFDVRETNLSIDITRVTRVQIDVYSLFKPEHAVKLELEPLTAKVENFSQYGVLTIAFNKKIFIPKIQVVLSELIDDSVTRRRTLSSQTQSTSEADQDLTQAPLNYTLGEVMELKVESSFFEDGQPEISIDDYNLTAIWETGMEVQIFFSQPRMLAKSQLDPDSLIIRFTERDVFLSQDGFATLAKDDTVIRTGIPRQYKQEEMADQTSIAEQMMVAMNTFSIVNLIVNLVLAIGFKFIWNMVTLLQFVVFMRSWLITIPLYTESFLKSLKSLALFEFIPTKAIKEAFLGLFGLDQSAQDADSSVDELEPQDEESFFDQLAVFFLAGIVILLILLILLLLHFLLKVSPKVQRCYEAIKRKLFYGTFISYLLLGTLKMQLATVGTLTIGDIISDQQSKSATDKERQLPDTGFKVFGWSLIVFLTLCPAILGYVAWKHRHRLNEPYIVQRFGAMFNGIDKANVWAGSYSFAFLIRRSLFVLITFVLYRNPSHQVQTMLVLTLANVCFLGHMRIHETRFMRRVEMLNESILMCFCYHFLFFVDPVWTFDFVETAGDSAVVSVCLILGINALIIFGANAQSLRQKLRLRRLRKLAEKKRAEQLEKDLAMKQTQEDLKRYRQVKEEKRCKREDPFGLLANQASQHVLANGTLDLALRPSDQGNIQMPSLQKQQPLSAEQIANSVYKNYVPNSLLKPSLNQVEAIMRPLTISQKADSRGAADFKIFDEKRQKLFGKHVEYEGQLPYFSEAMKLLNPHQIDNQFSYNKQPRREPATWQIMQQQQEREEEEETEQARRQAAQGNGLTGPTHLTQVKVRQTPVALQSLREQTNAKLRKENKLLFMKLKEYTDKYCPDAGVDDRLQSESNSFANVQKTPAKSENGRT